MLAETSINVREVMCIVARIFYQAFYYFIHFLITLVHNTAYYIRMPRQARATNTSTTTTITTTGTARQAAIPPRTTSSVCWATCLLWPATGGYRLHFLSFFVAFPCAIVKGISCVIFSLQRVRISCSKPGYYFTTPLPLLVFLLNIYAHTHTLYCSFFLVNNRGKNSTAAVALSLALHSNEQNPHAAHAKFMQNNAGTYAVRSG